MSSPSPKPAPDGIEGEKQEKDSLFSSEEAEGKFFFPHFSPPKLKLQQNLKLFSIFVYINKCHYDI